MCLQSMSPAIACNISNPPATQLEKQLSSSNDSLRPVDEIENTACNNVDLDGASARLPQINQMAILTVYVARAELRSDGET